MVKELLVGRKYRDEERWIKQCGTDAEIAMFYKTHKPLWKAFLCGAWNCICGIAFIGLLAFTFLAICAMTDYNWCPIH